MLKLGIYGYGNLGKGVECGIRQNPDMELVGIFTRRAPASVQTLTDAPVYGADRITEFRNGIDVLVICGGSATDLPEMTPRLAESFCVVDTFDTHANIPVHFDAVSAAAEKGGKLALISAGWDPGLFSAARVCFMSALPDGCDHTFWGRGVSQGHSDAIRRIDGVLDARQYTVPVEAAVASVRSGAEPILSPREKHRRECYVVAKEGADTARIEKEIKEMPNYFADYDTSVTFITPEEMKAKHSALPHGGCVIRTGKTGLQGENRHRMELALTLDSNPQFTASAVLACARAVSRMYARGRRGCVTVLDIAPADLSPFSPEELRRKYL